MQAISLHSLISHVEKFVSPGPCVCKEVPLVLQGGLLPLQVYQRLYSLFNLRREYLHQYSNQSVQVQTNYLNYFGKILILYRGKINTSFFVLESLQHHTLLTPQLCHIAIRHMLNAFFIISQILGVFSQVENKYFHLYELIGFQWVNLYLLCANNQFSGYCTSIRVTIY